MAGRAQNLPRAAAAKRFADPARVTTPLAIGLGLVALAARVPSVWAVYVTAGVGVVGLVAPLPALRDSAGAVPARSPRTWLAAVALGCAALVVAGRLPLWLGVATHPAGYVPLRATSGAVAGSVVAAIAEEAFFRRLVFGWLETWGVGVAVAGSAIAFAAIHIPVYGVAVFPIDVAAGMLLGWQRWMTRGWSASGATHAVANLIAGGWLP